ncbi:MAG: hypothetical protein JWO52_7831 [Gammaproteobacteria bacterium]|nr:hypothetical protein [Gammaproteobacteria bacterium]
MAQEYQASVQSEPLPGRPNPRFPDQVSPADTGFAIGKGLEDVGEVASKVYDKTQTQARQTQVTDANNQLQSLMLGLTHDPKRGAFAKQGKDAFNLGQQYLPQYDQASDAIVNSIPDQRARLAAQMMQQHVRGQLTEQLDSHELQQHEKYAVQTSQASIKIAQQQAAANYNHADILASNHDTIGYSIDTLSKQQGWSDEQTQEAKQQAYSSMHTNVIDRMLADDKPQMAQHYLGAIKNEMDAGAAWSAARTIDAHLKEKLNEAKQDIADRYQDSREAAERGLSNPVTVSRKELDILYPKDAQRHWDELQLYARAGAQAKQYDQMPADAIAADVKASEPKEGGPEALFQIKAQEIKARAAERSISSRAADPAQFVQNKGSWNRLDPNNPQGMMTELQSRARTQSEVSQQLGLPVPLLSKAEAHGLGQVMADGSSREQVGLLSALRSTLPSERAYQGIVNQIAPASPVTAVVGDMVERPLSRDTPSWYNPQYAPSPIVGERILRGERLLSGKGEGKAGTESDTTGTSKSGFALPSDADLQPAFNKALGESANLFQGRAQTAETYYKAFKDYYAAAAEQAGNTTGKFNKGIAQEAAQAVLGHTTEYGTSSLIVPRGMPPEQFEGHMDRAVNDALTTAGYGDREKELLKGYGVRELGTTVGTGRYAMVNSQGLPLKTPDGKETVIIDLHQQFPRAAGLIQR